MNQLALFAGAGGGMLNAGGMSAFSADRYDVMPIKRLEAEHYILNIHYAKRWPSVSWAFGLFRDGEIAGVCTYGTPSSATLRSGVCGDNFKCCVIELNRLCLLDNIKNEASFFVSRTIKLLPKGKIIVSFADTAHGHCGFVYQSCNFIYCGLSAKRTDWKVAGMEHLHGQTIADEFRGQKNRAQAMRDKYGERFYLKPRSRKHRYVIFHGSKSFKKEAQKSLRYEVKEYPKLTTAAE